MPDRKMPWWVWVQFIGLRGSREFQEARRTMTIPASCIVGLVGVSSFVCHFHGRITSGVSLLVFIGICAGFLSVMLFIGVAMRTWLNAAIRWMDRHNRWERKIGDTHNHD